MSADVATFRVELVLAELGGRCMRCGGTTKDLGPADGWSSHSRRATCEPYDEWTESCGVWIWMPQDKVYLEGWKERGDIELFKISRGSHPDGFVQELVRRINAGALVQ